MSNKRIIQVEEKVPFQLLLPLSIQHMFAMFGASVLVPFIFGISPAIVLFMNGLGTLLFILVTKGKAPAYLGSSFAFLAPAGIVIANFGYEYALGGFVAVGFCGCVLALIVYKFGTDWIDVVLPPAAMGPVVALIGLELSGTAASNAGLLEETIHPANLTVFLVTLGVAVFGSILFRGFLSVIPILIAVLAGYGAAVACGIVSFEEVAAAPWFAIPNFTLPKFNLEAIMIILPVILVITSEHIGSYQHDCGTGSFKGARTSSKPIWRQFLYHAFWMHWFCSHHNLRGKYRRYGYDRGIQCQSHCRCGSAVYYLFLYGKAVYADQYYSRTGYRRNFFPAVWYDWYFRTADSGGF